MTKIEAWKEIKRLKKISFDLHKKLTITTDDEWDEIFDEYAFSKDYFKSIKFKYGFFNEDLLWEHRKIENINLLAELKHYEEWGFFNKRGRKNLVKEIKENCESMGIFTDYKIACLYLHKSHLKYEKEECGYINEDLHDLLFNKNIENY